MLRLSMVSLVCALCSGVFGFGVESMPLDWAKGLFFVFLAAWLVCLIRGVTTVRSIVTQMGHHPMQQSHQGA